MAATTANRRSCATSSARRRAGALSTFGADDSRDCRAKRDADGDRQPGDCPVARRGGRLTTRFGHAQMTILNPRGTRDVLRLVRCGRFCARDAMDGCHRRRLKLLERGRHERCGGNENERREVQPQHDDDDTAERAVGVRVVREIRDIQSEHASHNEPAEREDRAAGDAPAPRRRVPRRTVDSINRTGAASAYQTAGGRSRPQVEPSSHPVTRWPETAEPAHAATGAPPAPSYAPPSSPDSRGMGVNEPINTNPGQIPAHRELGTTERPSRAISRLARRDSCRDPPPRSSLAPVRAGLTPIGRESVQDSAVGRF